MARRRVLFRCDNADGVGFGHFVRCLNLARALQAADPGCAIEFRGAYDAFAIKALRQHALERVEAPAIGQPGSDISDEAAAFAEANIVVLDSYRIAQASLDLLKGRAFRLAVFDDSKQYDLSGADLAICFRIGVEGRATGARREALGIGYLVVPPELRGLRIRNLATPPESIRNILVFLGGAGIDDGMLARVVEAVALPGTTVTYLTRDGRSVVDAPGAIAQAVAPDMERAYAAADLVVSGGGLVKYESAYCGIANACLSLTPLQEDDTQAMAARDLTLDLGPLHRFDRARVRDALSAFARDPGALAAQHQAFAHMLETDSPRRLADAILSL